MCTFEFRSECTFEFRKAVITNQNYIDSLADKKRLSAKTTIFNAIYWKDL